MRLFTYLLLSVLIAISAQSSFAQSIVKGEVVDDVDKVKLQNATVMLLQARDSILIDFARTDQDGRFSLSKPDSLDVLLMVSYPKFGDFRELLPEGSSDVDLGEVGLRGIEHLIEEVMVTGKIPVVIKGDTIEYDAGSFTVEKNAKVEDLLRVLPGITVDANGQITAQGKTVEKVLVDGEEFFGDDPTLVTRNIRSDMVDKVQVYEKKSDQAERTGVDDGERIQTINVTLKEDAKRGVFGKLEGAGGTDEFYMGKAAVHRFRGSQKIGAYILGSNDGQVNLGWQDEERFGFSQMETTDDGGIFIMGDNFSNWNGRGQPIALNTGLSFQDRWNEGKHKLNLNYKYGRLQNDVVSSINSLQNLQDQAFNQIDNAVQSTDNLRHRFNTRYDSNLDSLTTLTLKMTLSNDQGDFNNQNLASTFVNGTEQSLNDRSLIGESQTTNFTYDGLITRKLRKEGRSLSLRLAGNLSDMTGDAMLGSMTERYDATGDVAGVERIDQYKDDQRTVNNVQATATYTEPITDRWRTSVEYQFNNSRRHSINNSFDQDGTGAYTVLDEEFSNDFNFNALTNGVNLFLAYKSEKIEFNVNNRVRNDDLHQINNYENNELRRDFTTYNPTAFFRYNLGRTKGITFTYDHRNVLPTLTQIQPLRQNLDPLNIQEGNEALTPARRNTYTLRYNSYEMLKNQYFFGNISFTQENNSILQNVDIDTETTVRTYFFDNIRDRPNNTANFWIGTGRRVVSSIDLNARLGANGSLSDSYNFLNGELNRNQNYNYGVNIGAGKSTTKGIDFEMSVSPGWRRIESSLQPEFNSSGFVTNAYFDFRVYLPGKFQLFGEGSYLYEAPTEVFTDKFERLLFRPGVSRKFLRNESLVAEVYVNDVFNQNVGFSRSQFAGNIRQEQFNTISRFFMFKVSWDFTSMGGAQ